MKSLIVLLTGLLLFSCGQDAMEMKELNPPCNACGIENVQENLPWLKELIKKAEADTVGNYWGWIWLEKYKGQDIFVTNMMLGSGGIMYWFFDCSGNHLIFRRGEGNYCPSEYVGANHFYLEDEEGFDSFIQNMKLDITVYSTYLFDYLPQ